MVAILLIIVVLPLLAAVVSLMLNRLVSTRLLGFGSAVASALAGVALLLATTRGAVALPPQLWMQLDGNPLPIVLHFDALALPFALLSTFGGAIALLHVSLALPANVRGFGGLFGAAGLLQTVVLVGLALQEPLLLPLCWATAGVMSFFVLRASGTNTVTSGIPVNLIASFGGSLLLLAGSLALRLSGEYALVALVCWLAAGFLAFGAPPFQGVIRETTGSAAGVVALVLPLGLPLLGGVQVIRFVVNQGEIPLLYRTVLILAGLCTLLLCAAGGLGERSLRKVVGWQMSAQLGLPLVALGLDASARLAAASGLLLSALVTTLCALLTVALLERRAGTDDVRDIVSIEPMLLPAMAVLIAAAAAIGMPGTWGYWARDQLLRGLLPQRPLAMPFVLAGSTLLGIAWLAPLATLLRGRVAANNNESPSQTPLLMTVLPLVAALPLLVFGVMPQFVWRMFGLPNVVAPTTELTIFATGAAATLLLLPFVLRIASTRRIVIDQETQANGVFVPEALGYSLRGLVWLAAPDQLFARLWEAMLWISQALSRIFMLFEYRFYLASFMIGMVIVIMLLL